MRVKLNIFRFDPKTDSRPWYQTLEIDAEPEETVTGVLQYIQEHRDPCLAYRSTCKSQKCGDCALMVNASPCLACDKTIEPEMTIEPLPGLPVIKDLVVDRSQLLGKPFTLLPFLKASPVTEQLAAIAPGSFETSVKLSKCLSCLICQSVCPVLESEPERFVGPLGLVWLAQRSLTEPGLWAEKASEALELCTYCGRCWTVCPHGADILSVVFNELDK